MDTAMATHTPNPTTATLHEPTAMATFHAPTVMTMRRACTATAMAMRHTVSVIRPVCRDPYLKAVQCAITPMGGVDATTH